MIVLVETCIGGLRADNVIRSICILNYHRVETQDFSGDILVLWKSNVNVVVEINNFQFVHMKVKFPSLQD